MTKIESLNLLIKPSKCPDEAAELIAHIEHEGIFVNAAHESRKYNAVVADGNGAAMSLGPSPAMQGMAAPLLDSLLRRQ